MIQYHDYHPFLPDAMLGKKVMLHKYINSSNTQVLATGKLELAGKSIDWNGNECDCLQVGDCKFSSSIVCESILIEDAPHVSHLYLPVLLMITKDENGILRPVIR